MKILSRQFPIKRTNSRGHTTIIEGPNLFGPKSSFQPPKKMASFKDLITFESALKSPDPILFDYEIFGK